MLGKLITAAAAASLLVAACSSASSGQISITGLVDSQGNVVTVDRSAELPGQLRDCLPEGNEMDLDSFRAQCVMPYINGLWLDPAGLFRPHTDLAEAAKDWLLKKPADGNWPIYYPAGVTTAKKDLQQQLSEDPSLREQVQLTELPDPLPKPSAAKGSIYNQAGLMYLPNSYVVPGGIFNEQYGWDSYFIIAGLLSSAEYVLANPTSQYYSPSKQQMVQLDENSAAELAQQYFQTAKGMADNQAFMIEHYGGFVPNANRIYYLTRSQPPLFAAQSLLVYEFAQTHSELIEYKETLAPYLELKNTPTNFRKRSWACS